MSDKREDGDKMEKQGEMEGHTQVHTRGSSEDPRPRPENIGNDGETHGHKKKGKYIET